MSQTYRAVSLIQPGDVSNFRIVELPLAEPPAGHVRVRIHAASVNPVDYKLRRAPSAWAPEAPTVLGCDFAGVVEAVGPGVEAFRIGDAVYGCAGGLKGTHGGGYAEAIIADARLIAPKPATLSMAEAAALPLVGITTWEGLVDRARVQPGERVLVHGGAGGVGHVAIQLAKAQGAHVTATVSSPEKAEIAHRFGADETVDYRRETPADYSARLTGGAGWDVVYDSLGNENLPASFAAAALNGRVVSIVTAVPVDLAPMHAKGLSLHAVVMPIPMLYGAGREHHGLILRRLGTLVETGRLRPLLDPETFTLESVGAAHAKLEGGRAIGKVVVRVLPDA
ncbi:MAG TPA: zinc-dependent alcohol dehydrogenase family protein [Azospirillaceae bacterium]|nr:zinc-dependent alcohol dehydrogenase family protein [Azospirillaceae bacterium]